MEKKAYRGRMSKMIGKEPHLRGMWIYFLQERIRVKRFRELADEEKQAGTQGQWQQDPPAKEYLEQMTCCHDDCNEPMMSKETFRKEMEASEWAFDNRGLRFGSTLRGREDEHCGIDHAQKHGLLAAKHCARCRKEGVTMSYLCLNCNSSLLEDYVWWVSAGKKYTSWWCAICGEKYDWKQPNRLLVVQTGESVEQAKVFKAHAVPQGLCANLINAFEIAGEPTRRWRSPLTAYCEGSPYGELFFFLFEERADGPQKSGSVWAQHPAAWRASLLFGSEEAGICARQRGLQLLHRGWLSSPRVD